VRLIGRRAEERGVIPAEVMQQIVRLSTLTSSGVAVDGDAALRHSAVWACVNRIAQSVEMLPVDVVTKRGEERLPVTPTPQIVAEPSAWIPAPTWRYQVVLSLLMRGNAWGIITQTGRNATHPTRIELLHPDDVRWWPEGDRMRFSVKGDARDLFPVGDLWHLAAYTLPGSIIGLSPIAYAAHAIGAGLAAEQFGGEFFAGGGHPTGILTTNRDPGPDAADRTKEKFLEATRQRGVVLLPSEVSYQGIQISPEDSQFIDTQRFSVEQVCRMFGMQPEMIGSSSSGSSLTYANREERMLDFLVFALQIWITKIERALSACLPQPQEVKFNTGALLRSTTISRYRAHSLSLRDGWRSVNEVRALEDLSPVEGGDTYDVIVSGKSPVKIGDDDDE
jgi:HK97 family phage portal protein